LYYWRFGKPPSLFINPEVRTVFETTVQFFESIFTHHPRGRASEQEKRRFAREAAENVQEHVLEPYETLLKKAIENIALTIERGQQPLGEGDNPSEIKFQQLEQEAQQILEKHSKELADRLSEKRTVPESLEANTVEKRIGAKRDRSENVRISSEKPHSEITRGILSLSVGTFKAQASRTRMNITRRLLRYQDCYKCLLERWTTCLQKTESQSTKAITLPVRNRIYAE